MDFKEKEIKPGITFHLINTNKFKTNLMSVFLTTSMTRENVTKNALIPLVLRRGSKNMKTQEEISKKMEDLYGANFDCGLDKMGDNQVIKFYLETINDKYLPKKGENLLQTVIENLLEITFDPVVENGGFVEKYVDQEKNTIKQLIESKTDNKARYSKERCIEEMFKNEPYGLFKFGYIEDLEKINAQNLYEYYQELLKNCKIDIFLSGELQGNECELIEKNQNIQKLDGRKPCFTKPEISKIDLNQKEQVVTEKMDVAQGKLLLGLKINIDNIKQKNDVLVYNSVLGGTAASKLFQNVREKAHLAYVAASSYYRTKNIILINCGIEITNYEKALKIIKQQLEDMKNGDFTEDDLNNCKKVIMSSIDAIEDEQDTGIIYYFSKELSGEKTSIEEYREGIENVSKEDVIEIAKNVKVDLVYFLTKK